MSEDIDFKRHRDSGRARAREMTRDEKDHPDEKQDKKLIKSMVGKAKIKLASGGRADAEGRKAEKRLDKPVRGRFAGGGKTKHGGKAGTKVNVIVAGGGHPPAPAMGAPLPPPGGMATPPARPPMPAPGAMPPGAGGPPPPGAMMQKPGMPPMNKGGRAYNTGGKVDTKIAAPRMKFGAGGGKGRMEKAKDYGGKPLCMGGRD